MGTNRGISGFIRTHVLGLVAIFIALTGTALAAGGDDDRVAHSAASPAKQLKKVKASVAALNARIAALEAGKGAAAPPLGTAGGDLAGSYPNPLLAAGSVGADEIAAGGVTSAGILDGAVTPADIKNAQGQSFDDVDAASLQGREPHDFLEFSSQVFGPFTDADAKVTDTSGGGEADLIQTGRFVLRKTGTAHQFKVCAESNDMEYFVSGVSGNPQLHSVLEGACDTFSIGVAPGHAGMFTLYGPASIIFGTPYVTSASETDPDDYFVYAVGNIEID